MEAKTDIGQRCRTLFENPVVRAKGWRSNLFWRPENPQNPYGALRVDGEELEVLLAAIVGVEARSRPTLEQRQPGRASFIERSIAHGELPLLTYQSDS
ncbi:hypothetical protein [Acidithiobacillus sp. AMEEHan]|uniref:hypothetical protein n=1 Tax=Acidithiobacillus sp. AMEEHan TaxID=2994951 RepID=UPI0027E4017D|nr:hypothetical protein [Acidithiobacillus sp. AMEEHan]